MVWIPKPFWTKSSPLPNFSHLWRSWDEVDTNIKWWALDGLYWICGRISLYCAFPKLVRILYVGVDPSIFLLDPTFQRGTFGSPSVWVLGETDKMTCPTNWQLKRWQRAAWAYIHYYSPATWAEDRSYGYRTPIYMLNCIIRLQAVVKKFVWWMVFNFWGI